MAALLLDDFTRDDAPSGARWQLFTDRVMGGRSEARATRTRIGGQPCLVVEGLVRAEGNGGFVQVALPLDAGGLPLDATPWRAVRLTVAWGSGQWAVHLRTAGLRAPWQHYRGPVPPTRRTVWETVEVPFDRCVPSGLSTPLDRSQLVRLGIVAVLPAGPAQLAIARVELA
jgi:hypothetical protein